MPCDTCAWRHRTVTRAPCAPGHVSCHALARSTLPPTLLRSPGTWRRDADDLSLPLFSASHHSLSPTVSKIRSLLFLYLMILWSYDYSIRDWTKDACKNCNSMLLNFTDLWGIPVYRPRKSFCNSKKFLQIKQKRKVSLI